jgi:hypothetical protein
LRLTMSQNNRQLAARFSPESVTRDYLETYRAIVQPNRKSHKTDA